MRFGFADQVGAHIRRFGVNAAADAVEHRDDRTSERIGRKRHREAGLQTEQVPGLRGGAGDDLVHLPERDAEDQINKEDTEQRKAADAEAHDRAAAERDLERFAQLARHARLIRNADVGVGGDFHADVTGRAAHHRTDDKGDGRLPRDQQRENDCDDEDDDDEDLVLVADEGIRAEADGRGDFLHPVRALFELFDLKKGKSGVAERGERGYDDQAECYRKIHCVFCSFFRRIKFFRFIENASSTTLYAPS